jgi:alpha-beta hydrolase superfamily lysophospholipase
VLLRGWKVRAAKPNGDWVLVFRGVADNRLGVLGHARVLLMAGYGVVMMDARAHGVSEGPMATYGGLERNDTRGIVDALEAAEHPRHLFALGESMGAGIVLQSAAIEPRIEAVVAEAPFGELARGFLRLRRIAAVTVAPQNAVCARGVDDDLARRAPRGIASVGGFTGKRWSPPERFRYF